MDDSLNKTWHLSAFAVRERERANAARGIRGRVRADAKSARRVRAKPEVTHPPYHHAAAIAGQVHAWLNKHLVPKPAARQRPRARG